MSLFVVQHVHSAETCPAGDPEMGPMLLKILAPPNAANYGVTVKNEAVLDGKHTLYLTVDAEDEGKIQEFMAPFAHMGTVEVWPASVCERVVERKKC
jgi:hypothetical protein